MSPGARNHGVTNMDLRPCQTITESFVIFLVLTLFVSCNFHISLTVLDTSEKQLKKLNYSAKLQYHRYILDQAAHESSLTSV